MGRLFLLHHLLHNLLGLGQHQWCLGSQCVAHLLLFPPLTREGCLLQLNEPLHALFPYLLWPAAPCQPHILMERDDVTLQVPLLTKRSTTHLTGIRLHPRLFEGAGAVLRPTAQWPLPCVDHLVACQ